MIVDSPWVRAYSCAGTSETTYPFLRAFIVISCSIVVMFSFNPFWRGHTHGSYGLVFNTLMHFDALSSTGEEVLTEEDDEEGSR